MRKLYTAFWLSVLLLSTRVSPAQSISLLSNASKLCAGQPVSISFTTSGTFVAGNMFRVQLSANYGSTFTDLPGSFTSSPASVTLPTGNPSTYYVYRVAADKPQVFSSTSNSFRIIDKPTAQLTGSSAGGEPQNPYTPVSLNLSISGGSPYVYTLQNGQQITTYSDNSVDFLPVVPEKTTTYSLVSVQNNCGTGPVSGSATVLVNAVGFRLLGRVNESLCLGAQLPIYFSTAAPLPANTTFEAELISVNDGNRSVILPVTGSSSPLLVTLPKQFPGNSTYGYKLRIYSKAANISAWFRNGNTFSLLPPPRLALTAANPSIALGGQTTLKVLNQSLSETSIVVLNDGRELTLFNGADASTIVAPTVTTSYSIVSYTGACSEAITYDNRKVTVTIRPGARIDSLSTAEICAGQPIGLSYSTTPGFSLPPKLRV